MRNVLERENLDDLVNRKTLERVTIDGDSPVGENHFALFVNYLEYRQAKTTWRETGRTNLPRLNIIWSSIAHKYREGKVKSRGVTPVK